MGSLKKGDILTPEHGIFPFLLLLPNEGIFLKMAQDVIIKGYKKKNNGNTKKGAALTLSNSRLKRRPKCGFMEHKTKRTRQVPSSISQSGCSSQN